MAFVPPKTLRKLFPPMVTGVVLLLGGVNLVSAGINNWAGGSGSCSSRPTSGPFMLCPDNDAPHPLPWGSPEFVGLGFSVWITILIVERFGSPFLKNASIIIGLVTGTIIAGATGYIDSSTISEAPVITFIWTTTFPLGVSGPLILPLLATIFTIGNENIKSWEKDAN